MHFIINRFILKTNLDQIYKKFMLNLFFHFDFFCHYFIKFNHKISFTVCAQTRARMCVYMS